MPKIKLCLDITTTIRHTMAHNKNNSQYVKGGSDLFILTLKVFPAVLINSDLLQSHRGSLVMVNVAQEKNTKLKSLDQLLHHQYKIFINICLVHHH